ncbi:MAG: hypothetical protein C0469_03500 [Cyanobacteria bacterium DS2.3.42]|nr:hypothetical protein [Cyanobacteria bacterium DS2.3.42]
MEPGSVEPAIFNNSGGSDFGFASDFGLDHDRHDDHGHGDHFGDDHGGGDHDRDGDHANHNGNSLKGLIARLLGLDRDAGALTGGEAGSEAASHGGGDHGAPPSQSVMYSSVLAGISLSEAFKGIRVTPNFLYLCLFAGFTLWLFVVYWIRHNEPMANQVLGTGAVNTRHTVDDRRLLNSVKDAMPFRTSSTFGDIYTPNSPHVPPVQPIDQMLMNRANNAKPLPSQGSAGVPGQTLQQKLLSTAARQPYEMSAATAKYANQYVSQSVNQASMQAGYPSAQAYPPAQQFAQTQHRQQGYPQASQQSYSASPYATAYPNSNNRQIATAGSFYSMPQQGMQMQPVYALQPAPLMASPHGMGEAQQQFGTAGQIVPYHDGNSPRLKTVINR